MQNNTKSSAVAGVLGVFLGAFGGHDWYLGNSKKAITHVSLCVGGMILLIVGVILMNLSRDIPVFNMLFVCLVIAAYVILVGNGIWGFIEGVIILMQGDAGLAAKGYQVAPQTLGGNNMIQLGQQGVANGTANGTVAANLTPAVPTVTPTTAPAVSTAAPVQPAEKPAAVAAGPAESASVPVTEKPAVVEAMPVAEKPVEGASAPVAEKPVDSGAATAKPVGN